jgi:hypothetical protein
MLSLFKGKRPVPTGPDFSAVDSQAKAEALFRQGQLEQLFLMPLEFGGQDIPQNVLYVPLGVAEVKSRIDLNVIGPLVAEGKITQYDVAPEYQGNSFIPIALAIKAWDPGEFTTTINIWGEALARENA